MFSWLPLRLRAAVSSLFVLLRMCAAAQLAVAALRNRVPRVLAVVRALRMCAVAQLRARGFARFRDFATPESNLSPLNPKEKGLGGERVGREAYIASAPAREPAPFSLARCVRSAGAAL